MILPLLALAPSAYEKIEYRIPMRDGARLYTAVYVPKDRTKRHPILMERTPYSAGPYGKDKFADLDPESPLTKAGYIYVFQDVRGRYMSEGKWENVRPQLRPGQKGIDESTDTYDTISYLVRNVPANNGKVGLRGISYPGFYAGVGALSRHPALKAVSPQAPVADWWRGDDVRHNGAFFVQDNWDFSEWFDVPRKGLEEDHQGLPKYDRGPGGAYGFYLRQGNSMNLGTKIGKNQIPYWREILEHPDYDAYWKARELPTKMRDVRCAVLTVGGLYDAEDLWGALNVYAQTERRNPRADNFLIMGPWYHGMWADLPGRKFAGVDFGSDTSTFFRDEVEFPFFERYLNDRRDLPKPPEARIFETGANRWREFSVWPPRDLAKRALWFAPDRTLADAPPKEEGADVYVNDPNAPTPYLENPEADRRPASYMIADQRWATKRADVATFTGPALTAPFTMAGPVQADLWVTTTGTDGDFVVKLCDVEPDGTQRLVRAEVIRGRYRDSYERPAPFVPGRPTRVRFALNDVLHRFLPGHRAMVQVQSSWFPLVDRNPNRFVPVATARPGDYRKATIRILRGGKHPSGVLFGTLPE